MKTADRVYEQVKALPEPVQREVLDFVGYLAHKLRQEDIHWTVFSLKEALRGLEDETWPEYSEADLKERWP